MLEAISQPVCGSHMLIHDAAILQGAPTSQNLYDSMCIARFLRLKKVLFAYCRFRSGEILTSTVQTDQWGEKSGAIRF